MSQRISDEELGPFLDRAKAYEQKQSLSVRRLSILAMEDLLDTRAAARDVLKAFDDQIFVRDISHDHEPGWAIRQVPAIAALGRLLNLVGSAGASADVEAPKAKADVAEAGTSPARPQAIVPDPTRPPL